MTLPKTACLAHETFKQALLNNSLRTTPDAKVSDAVTQMVTNPSANTTQSYIIVEDNQKVVGILTRQDIMQLVVRSSAIHEVSVKEVMSTPVITVQESEVTDCETVLDILQQHHICHLPIVNAQMQLVSLITQRSAQQALLNHASALEQAAIAQTESGEPTNDAMLRPLSGVPDMGQEYVETAMQYLTEKTLATIGEEYFPELIRHLAPVLKVSHAFITEKVNTRLQMLAFWADGDLHEPLSYEIAKTPCERTLESGQFYCEHSVQCAFPEDQDLADSGVESYLGVALRNPEGETIGNLCILHQGPIQFPHQVAQLLLTFSARSSAELIRYKATQSLTQINQLLEEKVVVRTRKLALTQSAINSAAEGIFLIGVDGSLSYVNDAACTLLNCSQEELVNVCISDLNSDFLNHIWQQIKTLFKLEKTLTFESKCRDRNNESYPIEVTLNHIIVDVEEYLLLFVRDISDRKKSEDKLRLLYEESQRKTIQLQQSYQELKETQLQLIQAEKMSGLGHLVAGIAHEINNPITFILGNLTPALDYFEKLNHLLSLYEESLKKPSDAISQFTKRYDIDYILEDFPKLLISMTHGATRVQEIVQSLRTFSRLGGSDYNLVDVHENIDSTLVILQNRLNGRSGMPEIKVVKEYSDLPNIECYASLLNQVFMNILANAIDAIEERQELEDPCYTGQITIATALLDDCKISISIEDNGNGMDDDVKANIFNPFFTTKPVGIGTGMGLSISYQIVNKKHQGELRCESVRGEKTTFRIELWHSIPIPPVHD